MSTHPIKLLSHLFLIIFIHSIMNTITTLAQPDFRSYVCGDTGNYTKNSPYQTNLNTVLSNLHTTNSGFGFFNLSSGQLNSAALCQGDMEPDLCLSCLNNSIVKLQQVCPNQKQAVGYYGTCLLKYSDNTLLGNNQMEGPGIVVNVNTAQDSDQFVRDLDELMTKLKASAVVGGSLLKFATGSTTGTGFSTIYGLVQCTPDLSEMQCSDCLEDAYNRYVGSGFSGRVGGTVFLPACRYSYDISRFFNGSTLVIPPPPPPPMILQATPPVLAPPPRVF